MYIKIETGLIEDGKKQMVFLLPFARDCKVYKNYKEVDDSLRERNIPLVLLCFRWDGCFGFPGGFVDEGETLLDALKREALEEIAFEISDEVLNEDVKQLSTYSTESVNIHSFSIEVDFATLKELQRNSFNSEHFLAENQGCVLPQVYNFGISNGITAILKNNFKATAKLELLDLIKKENLDTND